MPSATTMIAPMHTRNYVKAIGDTALFFRGWREGERVVFAASRALDTRLGPPRMAPFTTVGLRCIASERTWPRPFRRSRRALQFQHTPRRFDGAHPNLTGSPARHIGWSCDGHGRVSSPMAVPSRPHQPAREWAARRKSNASAFRPAHVLITCHVIALGCGFAKCPRKASCDAAIPSRRKP